MPPIQWYYARNDQQLGPISSADLKRMAAAGELSPGDLVWREGMEEWITAENVRGLFDEGAIGAWRDSLAAAEKPAAPPKEPPLPKPAAPKAEAAPTAPKITIDPKQPAAGPGMPGRPALDHPRQRASRHLFDIALDQVRAQFTARFVDSIANIFVCCGHYGLYAAMAATFLFAMLLGVKTETKAETLEAIFDGLIWLLVLAVLQYVAFRFCGALDRLNRTTEGTISSTSFMDCFALLNLAIGVATLLTGAVWAVQEETYSWALFGLVVFAVCEYLAFVSLNPSTLNISVTPAARVGEEAIGVLTFLLKAVLRLVPVAFGAGVIYGTLLVAYACIEVFTEDSGPLVAQQTAGGGKKWLAYFAALPFATYLFFLVYYLSIDVTRAILSLPGKLDRLRKDKEE